MDSPSDDDFVVTSRAQHHMGTRKAAPQVRRCHECEFSTSTLATLKEHMAAAHKSTKLACDKCSHVAISTSSLREHKDTKHGATDSLQPRNFVCHHEQPQAGADGKCQTRFTRRSDLRKHLAEQHNVASAEEKIETNFASMTEFKDWKADYERRKGVLYTRFGNHPGQSLLFQCSRSGSHTPSGSGQRRSKSQGSSKLGMKCTSALHVREHDDGAVSAVLYPHHHGHSDGAANMPHLRIPARERVIAKAQLAAGVSTGRVLKSLRDQCADAADAGPSRGYWVQRKDIANLRRTLGISAAGDSVQNANEVISVRMHAERLRSSDQHHLLAFKMPGEGGTPETDSLLADDFVLAFCTDHQLRKFVQHGGNVVCMDGTHGTSGHDFHLITLLVLNEHGAGVPVGWLIASREDEASISCLIKGLARACSDRGLSFPVSKYFMSDKAMAFVNAWVKSTGQCATEHILCAWHVVRAWKGKLPLISDMVARQEAYDALWGIMHEPDGAQAVAAAAALVDSLSAHANTREFGRYFRNTWLDCVPKWALGRRDAGAGVTTNMHLEAFHRVLEYEYLEGRVNKRVDKCIEALLSFASDQSVQMARRQLWQGRTLHCEEIAQRHATAAQLVGAGQASAIPVADSLLPTWEVRGSAAEDAQCYRVEQQHRQCPESGCQQLCRQCRACVHHFRCSCPDWTSHKLICKHVHCVCLLVGGLSAELRGPEPEAADSVDIADNVPPPRQPANKQRLLDAMGATAARVAALPDTAEGATISAVIDKLGELNQLLDLVPDGPEPASHQQIGETSDRPWNARIQPQPAFRPRRAKRPRTQAATVHADGVTARALVGGLSRGDPGRERVPQVHHDHTY